MLDCTFPWVIGRYFTVLIKLSNFKNFQLEIKPDFKKAKKAYIVRK